MDSILEVVLVELNARKGAWPDVCMAVPEVKYSWLSKLAVGKIPEPSVVKIQALYNYFAKVPRGAEAAAVATAAPSAQNTEFEQKAA